MPDGDAAGGGGAVRGRCHPRLPHGVAAAHEASGRAGLLDPAIRPIQQGVRIAGPAVTVLCPPADNLMIHMAVEQCRPGDVLVVATGPPSELPACIGELLGDFAARTRGDRGGHRCGGARRGGVARHGFPRLVAMDHRAGNDQTRGGSGESRRSSARGRRSSPATSIVADDDGVVCVAAASAVEVAERVVERVAHEERDARAPCRGRVERRHSRAARRRPHARGSRPASGDPPRRGAAGSGRRRGAARRRGERGRRRRDAAVVSGAAPARVSRR